MNAVPVNDLGSIVKIDTTIKLHKQKVYKERIWLMVMAFGFGWLKKVGKALFTIDDNPGRTVLNYRGKTGSEESPFKKYSKDIAKSIERGKEEVSIRYGNRKTGHRVMDRVKGTLGTDYLESLVDLEKDGKRIVSVDRETGIVRRLKSTPNPFGVMPSEVIKNGIRTYTLYDTGGFDERGYKISYVFREKRDAEIEDRKDRLLGCFNEIIKNENSKNPVKTIERSYLERTLRELEIVAGSEKIRSDGKEYYARATKIEGNEKIIRYSKKDVDLLLDITKNYLENSPKSAQYVIALTKGELKERMYQPRRSESKGQRQLEYAAGS